MKKITLITAAALAIGLSGPAFADDRPPTAEERTKIEESLRAGGFTSWGDIELDDGRVWEVDDAKHTDGKEYDVDLDPTTYAIVKKDPD